MHASGVAKYAETYETLDADAVLAAERESEREQELRPPLVTLPL